MSLSTWSDQTPTNLAGRHAARGRVRLQLARLFRLVVLLQSRPGLNARELADQCEVSRRTIYRDIDLLNAAGIPVHYQKSGQGYQLKPGFFLQPPALDEREVLALNVVVRGRTAADGLGLFRHAMEGAVKVVQSLPPGLRERVSAVAGAIGDPSALREAPPDRREVRDVLVTALTRQRQVRLWYRASRDLLEECTKFAIYRLLLHDQHWFLVGRSSLHRRVEVVGVPWIVRAAITEDPYVIPPRFQLDRFFAQAWGVERSPLRYRVRLRFSGRVAPVVEETHRHRARRRLVLPGGGVELEFVVDGLDEILRWVQGFGDEVEVLEPEELRGRLFEVATRVAGRHLPRERG